MRIAIFTNNYLPNPYGVSGSIESFRKEFERSGHTVYIFAPAWKGYRDENPHVFRYPSINVKIKKIKYPMPIIFSRKISSVIGNLDIDIIHSQHPNLLGTTAARWAKKKNVPIIFTWHTLYNQYTHFISFIPQKLAGWWAIRNARNYANQCDAVIVPTPSVGEIIGKWGVTNKYITAIPTGVEEEQFSEPERAGIRKEYGIQDGEILLFVMTRLTAEKNMEFLADAVLDVLQKNRIAKFMICGEGSLKGILEKKVADAGLGERVIFVGIVSNGEKKNYYAAGDIFVYASKSETQGMILTEAMYSGLPTVAVRAPGVRDIVEDGRTGYLVSEDKKKFGDAVQKLLDDENVRRQFGVEAKKLAQERYTSKVCAEKMLEIYEKAIMDFPKTES